MLQENTVSKTTIAMESILKETYYDPKNPGSFGGIERLLLEVQKKTGLSRKEVKAFLLQQNTYTLHKDRRWRFPRNKVIALFKDEQWQADLAEMVPYASQNTGYRYILVVIDVFTKYAWAVPLKRKDPESVRQGFKDIFGKRIPCKLQTDRGKEFDNKIMRSFYEKYNILYFTSTNKTYKCSVVERLNRTLKGRMYRYFTSIGKRRWIDKLQDFVDSYNNSYHTSIKMTPAEASEVDNEKVFRNLYGVDSIDNLWKKEKDTRKKQKTIPKGASVRVAYGREAFDKGYHSTFTDSVGKVYKVSQQGIPMYFLKDYTEENVPRRFYRQELLPIPEPKYRVEKILKTQVKDGKKQYYVKWLNFPSSDNSWVDAIEDV